MNEALIRSIKETPVKYARALGFDLLTDVHNDWLRTMLLCPDDYTLLGHRGSYKTTCLSVALAFGAVLKPHKSTFFIRKTDDDVTEIVAQAQKILDSDLMHYVTYEIYGIDLELTTRSAYKIDTNLARSNRGQVQIQGMGLNGSVTGKHADYIYTDDIVNVKDRISRAEREQTKRQYMELQNVKNRGGRIMNTGTPWHKDDCISALMPNVHRYTVYDTGLITPEQQQHLRDSMSPSLYAANYELRHIADADSMFAAPDILPDTADNTSLIYGGLSHIDAAYGGDDCTAYTVMREQPDGTIVAYGKLWQRHVDECLPTIQQIHDDLRAGTIACEKNGDKGYLAEEIESMGLPVYSYAEAANKYIKISTYLRKAWPRIKWLAGTDPDYLAQILDYTEFATHDDAADSAASLVRYMQDRPRANTSIYLRGGW